MGENEEVDGVAEFDPVAGRQSRIGPSGGPAATDAESGRVSARAQSVVVCRYLRLLCLPGPGDGPSAGRTSRGRRPGPRANPAVGDARASISAFWAAALWAPVDLHYRGNTATMELDAVPISMGLVFLSPRLVVVGSVIATIVVYAVINRQRPVKVFFNVASTAFCASVAAIIFRELLARQSPASLRGWAALAAALLAKEVIVDPRLPTGHEIGRADRGTPHGLPVHDSCHGARCEHLPGHRRSRRAVVQPPGDLAARARGCV